MFLILVRAEALTRNAKSLFSVAVIVFSSLALVGFCTGQEDSSPSRHVARSNRLPTDSPVEEPNVEGTHSKRTPSTIERAAVDDAYRVGVEDELSISVWREPDLSTDVIVRPDGMITLPLINDVPVTGLTTKELQGLLTDKLKQFLVAPQVTVSVRTMKSRKVYLIGQVVRPGVSVLAGPNKTVLELLVEAGGLAPFAKVNRIYVLRNSNGAEKRIAFNYKTALKGADNLQLEPGDVVVVP